MQPPTSLQFFGSHATIQLAYADNADGLSMILFHAPKDHAPPFHVHHDEDEAFHIIEGSVKFRVGDQTTTAMAGQTVLGPVGVPHGFRVMSETAKILVVTKGGFERLVRAVGEPTIGGPCPPPAEPSPARQAELAAICAAHRIELLGPPIQ